MTDLELIQSLEDMEAAAPTMGIPSLPFQILRREISKRISRAGRYQALYESMCARYGAEEELPLLEE